MNKIEYTVIYFEDIISSAMIELRKIDEDDLVYEDTVEVFEDNIERFDIAAVKQLARLFHKKNPNYLLEFSLLLENGRNIDKDYLMLEIIRIS